MPAVAATSQTVKTMPPHRPLLASPMPTLPNGGMFTAITGAWAKAFTKCSPLTLGVNPGTRTWVATTHPFLWIRADSAGGRRTRDAGIPLPRRDVHPSHAGTGPAEGRGRADGACRQRWAACVRARYGAVGQSGEDRRHRVRGFDHGPAPARCAGSRPDATWPSPSRSRRPWSSTARAAVRRVAVPPVDAESAHEARTYARNLIQTGAVKGLPPTGRVRRSAGPPVRPTHELKTEADGTRVIRRSGFSITG